MKCSICSKTLAQTFLQKIIGSYVKDASGKMHAVCRECQTKFLTKKELIENLK